MVTCFRFISARGFAVVVLCIAVAVVWGQSPTPTPTSTGTRTRTSSGTPTRTPTPTSTPTKTPTSSRTPTRTQTPTRTRTQTRTSTRTSSRTGTRAGTPTNTPSETETSSGTLTSSTTTSPTISPTGSSTGSGSGTLTSTASPSATATASETITSSTTDTPSLSPTSSSSSSVTTSATATASETITSSLTATASETVTSSLTGTTSQSASASASETASLSATLSSTVTSSSSPTATASSTDSASATTVPTPTASATLTQSSTLTGTSSLSPSVTVTATGTVSPTSTSSPQAQSLYASVLLPPGAVLPLSPPPPGFNALVGDLKPPVSIGVTPAGGMMLPLADAAAFGALSPSFWAVVVASNDLPLSANGAPVWGGIAAASASGSSVSLAGGNGGGGGGGSGFVDVAPARVFQVSASLNAGLITLALPAALSDGSLQAIGLLNANNSDSVRLRGCALTFVLVAIPSADAARDASLSAASVLSFSASDVGSRLVAQYGLHSPANAARAGLGAPVGAPTVLVQHVSSLSWPLIADIIVSSSVPAAAAASAAASLRRLVAANSSSSSIASNSSGAANNNSSSTGNASTSVSGNAAALNPAVALRSVWERPETAPLLFAPSDRATSAQRKAAYLSAVATASTSNATASSAASCAVSSATTALSLQLFDATNLTLVGGASGVGSAAGPFFDASTSVFMGGLECKVQWRAPDGSMLSLLSPPISTDCLEQQVAAALLASSASAAGASLVAGAVANISRQVGLCGYASLIVRSSSGSGGGGGGATAISCPPICPYPPLPPACPPQAVSTSIVLGDGVLPGNGGTRATLGSFASWPPPPSSAALPPAAQQQQQNPPVYYTPRCEGDFTDPSSGLCSNGSAPAAANCAFISLATARCEQCPANGLCPGGVRVWPRVGFWVPNEFTPGSLAACPPPAAERCLGWDAANARTLCGATYKQGSSQCSVCAAGFYRDQVGLCEACPASATLLQKALPALQIFGALAAVFALAFAAVLIAQQKYGGTCFAGMRRAGLFILCVFQILQLVAQAGKSASPSSLPLVLAFYKALSVLLFEGFTLPPECTTSPPLYFERNMVGLGCAASTTAMALIAVQWMWRKPWLARLATAAAAKNATAAAAPSALPKVQPSPDTAGTTVGNNDGETLPFAVANPLRISVETASAAAASTRADGGEGRSGGAADSTRPKAADNAPPPPSNQPPPSPRAADEKQTLADRAIGFLMRLLFLLSSLLYPTITNAAIKLLSCGATVLTVADYLRYDSDGASLTRAGLDASLVYSIHDRQLTGGVVKGSELTLLSASLPVSVLRAFPYSVCGEATQRAAYPAVVLCICFFSVALPFVSMFSIWNILLGSVGNRTVSSSLGPSAPPPKKPPLSDDDADAGKDDDGDESETPSVDASQPPLRTRQNYRKTCRACCCAYCCCCCASFLLTVTDKRLDVEIKTDESLSFFIDGVYRPTHFYHRHLEWFCLIALSAITFAAPVASSPTDIAVYCIASIAVPVFILVLLIFSRPTYGHLLWLVKFKRAVITTTIVAAVYNALLAYNNLVEVSGGSPIPQIALAIFAFVLYAMIMSLFVYLLYLFGGTLAAGARKQQTVIIRAKRAEIVAEKKRNLADLVLTSTDVAKLNEMMLSLQSEGDLEGALAVSQRLVALAREAEGGDTLPAAICAMKSSRKLLHDVGRFDDSASVAAQVAYNLRITLGPEHEETLGAIADLAAALYALEKYDKALRFYTEVLQGRRGLFGDTHELTLASIRDTALCLHHCGNHEDAVALEAELIVLEGNEPPLETSSLSKRLGARSEERAVVKRMALSRRRVPGSGGDKGSGLDAGPTNPATMLNAFAPTSTAEAVAVATPLAQLVPPTVATAAATRAGDSSIVITEIADSDDFLGSERSDAGGVSSSGGSSSAVRFGANAALPAEETPYHPAPENPTDSPAGPPGAVSFVSATASQAPAFVDGDGPITATARQTPAKDAAATTAATYEEIYADL